MPIGTVLQYAGNTPPQSFLSCNGQAVSRVTYSSLFNVISTTTFNLPDLRGRTIIGSGAGSGLTNRNINDSGGAETVTLTIDQMPGHNHTGRTTSNGTHTHSMINNNGSGATSVVWLESGNELSCTNPGGDHVHDLIIDNKGGSQAHQNMQPFRVLNYIIKCF
jgi:microcystin-dependent protein